MSIAGAELTTLCLASPDDTGNTATTSISTQDDDDFVFISSEANQNIDNAETVDVLLGWLDYIEEDLSLDVGSGRHRLLISDERSPFAKGYSSSGSPALLTNRSLTNIGNNVGDIFFDTSLAEGSRWADGVRPGFNLWLGQMGDRLNVTSVPSNPGAAPLLTTTAVHAGDGDDRINVALAEADHEGVVFVANGQNGDDVINASESSLSVILIGEDGSDSLFGGSNEAGDVLIGDFGRVEWKSNGTIVASAGGRGYGDFTDGFIRNISEIYSVRVDEGGNDTMWLGDGDDVGIGGVLDDTIYGEDGRDIIVSSTYHIRNVLRWLAASESSLVSLCVLPIVWRLGPSILSRQFEEPEFVAFHQL